MKIITKPTTLLTTVAVLAQIALHCGKNSPTEAETDKAAEVSAKPLGNKWVIEENQNLGAYLKYSIYEISLINNGDKIADDVKLKVKWDYRKSGELYDTYFKNYSLENLYLPSSESSPNYEALQKYGRKFIMPGEETVPLWIIDRPPLVFYFDPKIIGYHNGLASIVEITWK